MSVNRLRSFFIFLLLLSSYSIVSAQTLKQKEKNLKAFTELYGYVRFFHPSDEATKVNWFLYSLYGVHQVMSAQNDRQLITELKALMLAIAPSVIIDSIPIPKLRVLSKIIPEKVMNYKLVNWVHKGLSLPAKNIYAAIPHTLYATKSATYPQADTLSLTAFKNKN